MVSGLLVAEEGPSGLVTLLEYGPYSVCLVLCLAVGPANLHGCS